MSTCVISQNQPIYQALLDKAASYPADKPYQAKAYRTAAESVLSYDKNLYEAYTGQLPCPSIYGIGNKIEEFICEFVKTNPVVTSSGDEVRVLKADEFAAAIIAPLETPPNPVEPAQKEMGGALRVLNASIELLAVAATLETPSNPVGPAQKEMDEARERVKEALITSANKFINDYNVAQSITVEVPKTELPPGLSRTITCGGTLKYCGHPECPDNTVSESVSSPTTFTVATTTAAMLLGRGRRNIGKPRPKYFDEEDEIAETIESFCIKKHLFYDDELVTEFKDWLLTADRYALERYDYSTNKFIPYPKAEVVIYWAHNFSTTLKKQQKEQKLNKALIKYCEKNGFEYNPLMDEKCGAWMDDPVNKELLTYTIYSRYCKCSDCNPTGVLREDKKYTYDRASGYSVNKWFATLKKQIIW
uniref:Uncharacterized protein n=1 Tax=viral metagenome TaxID=1070528 RepID=A0A6C0DWV6_9ZZZZ